MSNIFVLRCKFKKKKKKNFKVYIWLIVNIYQYVVDNVILFNSTLCIPPSKQDFYVQFS